LRHDKYDGALQTLILSDLLMEQPVEVRIRPLEDPVKVSYRWPNRIGWPAKESEWQLPERADNSYIIPIPEGRSEVAWGKRARLHVTLDRWNEEEENSPQDAFVYSARGSQSVPRDRRSTQAVPVGADS
jgi:hypothetical protein